jgi:hypothetical protein
MTVASQSTQSLVSLLLTMILLQATSSFITAETIPEAPLPAGWTWIAASDSDQVTRTGDWKPDRFRFAHAEHLYSTDEDASLSLRFQGTAIGLRLGAQNTPAYSGQGGPSLGRLVCHLDGKRVASFRSGSCGREILLATGLAEGEHELTVRHQLDRGESGCRVEGFLACKHDPGLVSFTLQGERQAFLVDVRATIMQGERVVRSVIARNWLNGDCSLLVPTGEDYSLRVEAAGWLPENAEKVEVTAGVSTRVSPFYLERDPATEQQRFRFPALNRQAIRMPGESLRARFLGFDTTIKQVRIVRVNGPATFSRILEFVEDEKAAYYYDREVIARLPKSTPAGVYDLEVTVEGGRRTGLCRSPRSVVVVPQYPTRPVFLSFGHLDTNGQYQAEYLSRIADIANLAGADMVLNSNAVNAAYISGALTGLQVPYVVNFGNHQVFGHPRWYGDPVGMVRFGPHLAVLNFGHPWHHETAAAEKLLASNDDATIKVINGFEANAPQELLKKYSIALIHDAHGIGEKVMEIDGTPTLRVGKSSSTSFRMIRFDDRKVISATYQGDPTAPFPLARNEVPPLRVRYLPASDGTARKVTVHVTNDYKQAFPQARARILLPAIRHYDLAGTGECDVESANLSDDKKYLEITLRFDLPAESELTLIVSDKVEK